MKESYSVHTLRSMGNHCLYPLLAHVMWRSNFPGHMKNSLLKKEFSELILNRKSKASLKTMNCYHYKDSKINFTFENPDKISQPEFTSHLTMKKIIKLIRILRIEPCTS